MENRAQHRVGVKQNAVEISTDILYLHWCLADINPENSVFYYVFFIIILWPQNVRNSHYVKSNLQKQM